MSGTIVGGIRSGGEAKNAWKMGEIEPNKVVKWVVNIHSINCKAYLQVFCFLVHQLGFALYPSLLLDYAAKLVPISS